MCVFTVSVSTRIKHKYAPQFLRFLKSWFFYWRTSEAIFTPNRIVQFDLLFNMIVVGTQYCTAPKRLIWYWQIVREISKYIFSPIPSLILLPYSGYFDTTSFSSFVSFWVTRRAVNLNTFWVLCLSLCKCFTRNSTATHSKLATHPRTYPLWLRNKALIVIDSWAFTTDDSLFGFLLLNFIFASGSSQWREEFFSA